EPVRCHYRDYRGCEIDRGLQQEDVAMLHARSIVAAGEGALRRIEAAVYERIEAVFARCPELFRFSVRDRSGLPDHLDPTTLDRCPQLHGFTVQDSSALPEELRSLALERELVVTDIGVYPFINAEQCEAIYNEIAVALLDFMFDRPSAKDVLRGRTFVRTLH